MSHSVIGDGSTLETVSIPFWGRLGRVLWHARNGQLTRLVTKNFNLNPEFLKTDFSGALICFQ